MEKWGKMGELFDNNLEEKNPKDDKADTPLHMAAKNGSLDT